ncbi:MAG: hypothetical protein US49_C0001G0247 [candidate division TM6 bacterium GW2011_GWF2_37_49]|nr:MAG: hypothetical protein US49_C0001G0247 [candidate division TM6 bacterium GW2011_GWF2_37_49]
MKKVAVYCYFFILFIFQSICAYQHETLSAWTIDCFKNLEEPDLGKFKTQLTAHDFKGALRDFINYYQIDKNGFTNRNKWVNPKMAPDANSDLFDFKNKNEYVCPYVQKLVVAKSYPDAKLLSSLKMQSFIPEKKRFKTKFFVMGDIHGSLHSLLRSLWRLVIKGYLDDDFAITRPNFYMIFTGDYVDRGGYSPDVIYTLIRLKLKNQNKVFLLRGNHEDLTFNKNDPKYLPSMWLELNKKYGHQIEKLEPLLCRFYDLLIHALYIVCDDVIVKFCHGGVEPLYDSSALLKNSNKFYEKLQSTAISSKMVSSFDSIKLLQTLHQSKFGPMLAKTDFVQAGFNWCDLAPNLKATQNIKVVENRGYQASMGFIDHFMKDYGIQALFRGHQHYAFGLKLYKRVDGSAQNGDHWRNVVNKNEQNNEDGFPIKNKAFYPVFTFSTAAASSAVGEKINLPYDCFAIISVGSNWNEWRLKPYEFEHNKRIMFNLDKNYVSIARSKIHSFIEDPLTINYWKKPPHTQVDAKLVRMAEVNSANLLISDVQLYQTLNPTIKAGEVYSDLIKHLHERVGWNKLNFYR